MRPRKTNLRYFVLLVLAMSLAILHVVSASTVSADGDPLDACEGDYVLVEKTDPNGNVYVEAECESQDGSDWWKWALGALGVGGGLAYTWNVASSRGSRNAGAGDSRM